MVEITTWMIVSPSRGSQGELFVSSLSDSEFCPVLVIQCLAEIPRLCGFVCRSVFPWSSGSGFRKSPSFSQTVYRFSISSIERIFVGCYRFRFVPSLSSHILSSVQCWWSNVHQKFVGSRIPSGNGLTRYPGYRKTSDPSDRRDDMSVFVIS